MGGCCACDCDCVGATCFFDEPDPVVVAVVAAVCGCAGVCPCASVRSRSYSRSLVACVTSSGVSFVSVRAAGISCTAGKTPSEEQPDRVIPAKIAVTPASARPAMRRLLFTIVPAGPHRSPLRLKAAAPLGSRKAAPILGLSDRRIGYIPQTPSKRFTVSMVYKNQLKRDILSLISR
jgi:hypothetical protein